MKTLYLDCSMGAAGDMLTAALLELMPDTAAAVEELNALGIPGVRYTLEPSVKCGVTGSHMRVTVNGVEEGDEAMYEASEAAAQQGKLSLPAAIRKDFKAVYGLIAAAESKVHGVPMQEIHFHEVGTMDAIADVAAVCYLMQKLSPDEVVVSPIHVGSGQVKCAHGILPVPAPATALILKDVPIYGGTIQGELCTPTGAALLKHFATRFGPVPAMRTTAIGYGMGKKDFEAANCVRAMLGESDAQAAEVLELACNVDDMTGEQLGFALEQLFAAGALDVFTIPVGTKKSRPATLLQVLCRPEDRETMVDLLFRHTTTLGVRETRAQRHVLHRSITTVETPYGPVRRKDASGYGVQRSKYEYEDLARIAREQNCSMDEVVKMIQK